MVILHVDCSDRLCCLNLLGLLFAFVLGLGLVLDVTLVHTIELSPSEQGLTMSCS